MTTENETTTKGDGVPDTTSPSYVRMSNEEMARIGQSGGVRGNDGFGQSAVKDEQTSEWHPQQVSNGPWHKNWGSQTSVISRLCSACNQLFKEILNSDESKETMSSEILRKLDRSRSRIVLWCQSHDVLEGGLDDLISESRIVRHETTKLLVSIAETIVQRLVPALHLGSSDFIDELDICAKEAIIGLYDHHEDDIDYESDSSQDSAVHIGDSLGLIAARLDTDSLFLMNLDSLIRVPPLDSMLFQSADSRFEPQMTESINPFLSLVQGRFPLAEAEIAHRLASANLERLQRCTAEREISLQGEGQEEGTLHAEKATNQTKSAFDSGIGSSLRTGTSGYAETVMVYENKGRSVSIPPMPQEAQNGKFPFDCVACGQRIRVLTNSEWKKHLYSDLKPWICLDPECSYGDTAFNTRSEWLLHLGQEHSYGPEWGAIHCPLCRENTGSGMSNVTSHLAAHMEELSLSVLPKDLEDEADNLSQETRPDPAYALSIAQGRHPAGISDDTEHTRDPLNDQKAPPDLIQSNRSVLETSTKDSYAFERDNSLEHARLSARFAGLVDTPSDRRQHTASFGGASLKELYNSSYSRPEPLVGHLQTHALGRRFVCEICPKSFARQDLLLSHIANHEGSRATKPLEPPATRGSSSAPSSRISHACRPCAAARVKCDDIKPCRRCVSRNLACLISRMTYTAPSVKTSGSQIDTPGTDSENASSSHYGMSDIGQWKHHGPDRERIERERIALEKEKQEFQRQKEEFNKERENFMRQKRGSLKEEEYQSSP